VRKGGPHAADCRQQRRRRHCTHVRLLPLPGVGLRGGTPVPASDDVPLLSRFLSPRRRLPPFRSRRRSSCPLPAAELRRRQRGLRGVVGFAHRCTYPAPRPHACPKRPLHPLNLALGSSNGTPANRLPHSSAAPFYCKRYSRDIYRTTVRIVLPPPSRKKSFVLSQTILYLTRFI
jgi:hypothetical protein